MTSLSISACLAFLPFFVFGQADSTPVSVPRPRYYHHELTLGNNFLPRRFAIQSYGYNSGAQISYDYQKYTGGIFISYKHYSEGIAVGITTAIEYEEGSWVNPGVHFVSNIRHGTFRRTTYTIAPEITFKYCDIKKGLIRLYGTVGVGYVKREEYIKYGNSAIEVPSPFIPFNPVKLYGSPIGVRVGRKLNGFCEFGIGYRGILNYGLTYRF